MYCAGLVGSRGSGSLTTGFGLLSQPFEACKRFSRLRTLVMHGSGGGKLLLWHGFNDPGPSPLSTIAYYEAVQKAVPAARGSTRLFLAPGVLHCGGGSGPDRFDTLTALENWVERGVPPASMLATKQGSPLSRPLCPYPALPRYKGTGDPNDAASFACAAD